MPAAIVVCVISVLLVLLGCNRQEGSITDSSLRKEEAAETPRQNDNVMPDVVVLSTVLHDLLTYSGDDSPVAVQGIPPKEILFSAKAVDYSQTIEEVLYQHQTELWKKLTSIQMSAAREAAGNLVERIKNREFPKAIQPDVEGIRMYQVKAGTTDEDADQNAFQRPIQAWPAGYSDDKRFAVVRLVIPWSIHHAEGTYLLMNDNGNWMVYLRQFVYYL